MTAVTAPLRDGILEAFSEDLYQIAFLHSKEPTAELLKKLINIHFPLNLGVVLSSVEGEGARSRIKSGLSNVPQPISQREIDLFAVDFADIYLNHTFGASPFESVWIDDDNLALQEPTFQVREFFGKYDLRALDWRVRSEDHIVPEIEFVAFLLEEGEMENAKIAARFLDEHLLRWAPQFFDTVSKRAATTFFSSLAELTKMYLLELRTYIEVISGEKRPTKEEIDARMKPQRLVNIGPARYVPGAGPTV